jgi:hypothetical protein
LAITLCACSQPHQQPDGTGASRADGRQLVPFPDAMRVQTLANMRDHLLAIQQINDALSRSEFEKAAGIAEKRLGMTSLEAHDASHLARLMPQGMQDIGSQMHRAASRFSIEAQNATATNDVRPVLAALNPVLQQCAACHATYRLQ